MTSDTLIVHTWNSLNPFNVVSIPLHQIDYTPDLALRLSRILTGDNSVIRSQVVHAGWRDDYPFLTRTDVAFDGSATVRTANYITTRNGIVIDHTNPYTEVK